MAGIRGLSVQLKAVGSQAEAQAIVAKAKAAGITTLFFNVSAMYSPGSSFDRLGTLIEVAGEAGLAVFPWLCPGADPYFTSRWPVAAGGFTDYGNVDARAAMAAGVATLVTRYPGIRGVVTDYIREAVIDGSDYTADDVTAAVYGMEAAVDEGMAFIVTVKAYAAGSHPDWDRWGQPWPTWLKTWIAQGKKKRYAMPMVYSPTKYGDFAPHVQAWLDAGVPLANLMPKMSVINTQIAGEKTPKTAAAWATEFELWKRVGLYNVAGWDQRLLDLPEHLATFAAFELAEEADPGVPSAYIDLSNELTMLWSLAADLREIATVQEEQITALQEVLTAQKLQATALQENAEEIEGQVEGMRGKL